MSFVFETRGATDPTLITELLTTLLEVHGKRVPPSLTQKRVRGDVRCASGAENPWRRSPSWSVIRLGLMRHLHTLHGLESRTRCYKILLCQLRVALVAEGIGQLGPDGLKSLKCKTGALSYQTGGCFAQNMSKNPYCPTDNIHESRAWLPQETEQLERRNLNAMEFA